MDPEKVKIDAVKTWLGDIDGDFAKAFMKEFDRLLHSGALDPEEIDWHFARCVLVLTAEKYVFADKTTKMLRNLRHF